MKMNGGRLLLKTGKRQTKPLSGQRHEIGSVGAYMGKMIMDDTAKMEAKSRNWVQPAAV